MDTEAGDNEGGKRRGAAELNVVPRSRAGFIRRLEWIVIILAGAARMWLAPRALQAIGWATYDDHWFVERAQALLAGEWLGAYDHMTLIKGAGYPLWIAFCNALRIPLLFMQHLLYVLACLAVCVAVAPVVRSGLLRASMFVVLAFNPMTFAYDIGTRASREGIYPALTLFVFAACVNAVLRLDAAPARRVFHAAVCGFAVAIFWITREEGVWIVPLLAFAALAGRAEWRRVAIMATAAAAAFWAVYGSVMLANALRYGVAAVVARFRVDLPPGRSFLVLSLRGKEIERIPITARPRGSVHPDIRMSIEEVMIETGRPQGATQLRIMRWIGTLYGYVFGPFFILAAVVFLLRVRQIDGTTTLFVIALLSAVAGRVLILALIDVTSFVVFTPGYQTPMYPLVLIAGMLMAYAATATFGTGRAAETGRVEAK